MEFTIPIPNQHLDWFDSLEQAAIDMALKCYCDEINAAADGNIGAIGLIRSDLNSSAWLRMRETRERTICLSHDAAHWVNSTSRRIDPVSENYVEDIAKQIILTALSRLAP